MGRLIADKGVREFAGAAAIVKRSFPKTRFQIVGEFDEGNPAAIDRSEFNSWVASGAVEYLGISADIRLIMDNATAVVLPSFQEGLSRVLMEALAMGKPIIASDIRGCKELVDNGRNGFLVKPRDVIDLSEKCLKILDMTDSELASLGRNSLTKSGEFSILKTISFYKKIVEIE